MRVLVVNAGSSSLKLRLLDGGDAVLASRDLAARHGAVDEAELGEALAALAAADAVGHRIVHGGTRFRAPVRLDAAVAAELAELGDLAPLHQAASLAVVASVGRTLPGVPAVACFDTAFHATLPPAAATYALPAAWRERWALRRYGFHGLSHGYAARRAAELLDRPIDSLRVVTCHLGAGASLAAVREGVSVDTTMGFTPLEGLVMATRSGSVDPGLLLWLLEREELAERELAEALERRSGLLALAGTADMAEVVARAEAGKEEARLAFDVYVHRLRAGIAAMCVAMGGMDALVFTGGVGEHSPEVRAAASSGLGLLGVELDQARNEAPRGDEDIGAADASVRTLVVTSREDLEIARQVRGLLGERSAPTRVGS
ncbi:MAG: acetate/propionate family kinase [bacterium]